MMCIKHFFFFGIVCVLGLNKVLLLLLAIILYAVNFMLLVLNKIVV